MLKADLQKKLDSLQEENNDLRMRNAALMSENSILGGALKELQGNVEKEKSYYLRNQNDRQNSKNNQR